LTAAAVTAVGGLLGQLAVAADAAGYQQLLAFARTLVPGRRCFAVEGAGSYGAGLTSLLAEQGEWMVEVDRPKRPVRRGGKSDALDAVRAAREALSQERPAVPRRRGDREALRVLLATRRGAVTARTCAVNQLKALIASAPGELRGELRNRNTNGQVAYCAALRDRRARSLEHRMTVRALRSTAQRIRVLTAEAAELEEQISRLVAAVAVIASLSQQLAGLEAALTSTFGAHPDAGILRSQPGLGVVLAARVLAEFGDDPNRYAGAKARKAYAGTAPITRASGLRQVVLARAVGNRRLTTACHLWAFAALTGSPGARRHYDAHRARGATNHQALRALGNRLVGILHGCLRRHRPYDEAVAWPATTAMAA
jgi:transposase